MHPIDTSPVERWVTDIPSWVALAQLAEELKSGGVLPFLGAGLSTAIGYPDWNTLVGQLQKCVDPKATFRPGDLPQLADRLRRAMGERRYRAFLAERFRCQGDVRDKIKASATWQELARMPFPAWLTMNYDCALEAALECHAQRKPESVDWVNRDQLNTLLLWDPRRLFHPLCVHLHGIIPATSSAGPPSNIILTEQDYQDRYLRSDEDRSKLFLLATSRTLLFIGSSLTDVDLMGVLREGKAKLGFRGHRHYAILPRPSEEEEVSAQRHRLSLKYGTQPIFYDPVEAHSGLAAVLRFLRETSAIPDSRFNLPRSLLNGIQDDPRKGRFGLSPARGSFQLQATAEPSGKDWFDLELRVDGPGEVARFYLHPTFASPIVRKFAGHRATLKARAWGAFTVGVQITHSGGARFPLELDLAECEHLPMMMRML